MDKSRVAPIWAQRVVIGVMLALVAGLVFRLGDSRSDQIDLRDPTAWVASSLAGEILQVNGVTGEVLARLPLSGVGDDVEVAQSGSNAFALNRSKGEVAFVDGRLQDSRYPQPRARCRPRRLAAQRGQVRPGHHRPRRVPARHDVGRRRRTGVVGVAARLRGARAVRRADRRRRQRLARRHRHGGRRPRQRRLSVERGRCAATAPTASAPIRVQLREVKARGSLGTKRCLSR